jgi:ABC-type ATPase involved in cell division
MVLADEPTAMLDRGAAASVLAVLRDAHARGVTMVVASHDPDVAKSLGVRRLLLRGGCIEEATAKRGSA